MQRRNFLATAAAGLVIPAIGQAAPKVITLRVPSQYPSVSEAVAALPDTGGRVEISPGVYKGKLIISKPDVHLIGKGKRPEDVVIVWGDNAQSPRPNATVHATGDGLRATNLTIQNDYHLHNEVRTQALAIQVSSDRAVFRKVRFLGAQDTLMASSKKPDVPSRQYYKDCYIEGHIDFIFGNALAFFDHCHLHVIASDSAYITAHSRSAESETTAYIFDHCRITADAQAKKFYFGRAWRAYAQVVFLHTRIDAPLEQDGWAEWTPGKTETYKTAAFSEYKSTGPGGNMSRRIPWARTLTDEQAVRWRRGSVFKDQGWIRS